MPCLRKNGYFLFLHRIDRRKNHLSIHRRPPVSMEWIKCRKMVRNFFEYKKKYAQMPRPKTEGRNMFAFFSYFLLRERRLFCTCTFFTNFYFVFFYTNDVKTGPSQANQTIIIFYHLYTLYYITQKHKERRHFFYFWVRVETRSRKEIELNHIIVVNFHKLYGNFPSPASFSFYEKCPINYFILGFLNDVWLVILISFSFAL